MSTDPSFLFGVPDEDADYLINEKAARVAHVLPRPGSSLRWDDDFDLAATNRAMRGR